MATNIKNLKPARIISPGEIIADEIESRMWTQEDFADIIGVSIQTVNKLIKNKTSITTEMAVALGAALGQSTEFWINLDTRYRSLKFANKEKEVALKSEIYALMPIGEMAKRNWIDKGNILESILSFFRCDKWETIRDKEICGLFKKSDKFTERFNRNAANCWFQRAKNISETITVAPYDSDKLEKLLSNISQYTIKPNGLSDFLDELTNCGVKFFVLPHLSKTFTDGAAFYKDGNPVIVYTARHKRLDNFWFVLAHEIVHILRHLNGENWYIIETDEIEINNIEKEANQEAQKALKHNLIYQHLKDMVDYLPIYQIKTVASTIGIHPCIIIGAMSRIKEQYHRRLHEFNEELMALIPDKYQIEKLP